MWASKNRNPLDLIRKQTTNVYCFSGANIERKYKNLWLVLREYLGIPSILGDITQHELPLSVRWCRPLGILFCPGRRLNSDG